MAKKRTFAQARSSILEHLRNRRWNVKANLKIPHATSESGEVRLWFKPQAVHFTCTGRGGRHEFKDARTISYDLDMRKIDAGKLADYADTGLCKR